MNERDEHAIKQEAKHAMDAQQLRHAVKDAYKELIGEYVREFGWWSLKTLGALLVGTVIAGALYLQVRGG